MLSWPLFRRDSQLKKPSITLFDSPRERRQARRKKVNQQRRRGLPEFHPISTDPNGGKYPLWVASYP
jgi:hypothetical protein